MQALHHTPTGLELAIAAQEARFREQYSDDEEYEREVSKLVESFPKTQNGSRFINSYITLQPQILVLFKDLQPLLAGKSEGKLFLDEVGVAIKVQPLEHHILGSFTQKRTILVIQNLRLIRELGIVSACLDIRFGNEYTVKDKIVSILPTGELVIPLEEERIHISQDGVLLRTNGKTIKISQVTQNERLRWINFELPVNVPFKVNI